MELTVPVMKRNALHPRNGSVLCDGWATSAMPGDLRSIHGDGIRRAAYGLAVKACKSRKVIVLKVEAGWLGHEDGPQNTNGSKMKLDLCSLSVWAWLNLLSFAFHWTRLAGTV